ncbi:uncharacterized protein TNCV_1581 [Trichonephila clavipes]|nr:uncharacterized protein TNCV_1581 [Trichonephila clavipes]
MLVYLIASKYRVAPTKQTTIPRLKLCTAVLLAKLVHRVKIATIQEMTSSEQWRYVATEDSPPDFVSRGMDSLKLKTCELWWNGPKFLMSNQYPQRQIPFAVIKDPGRKILTPFSKLINVTEGAEYVGRNIEKLFDEARQNMRKQHKNWEKYYNRKRRKVNIMVNDLVLVQTHFIWAVGR